MRSSHESYRVPPSAEPLCASRTEGVSESGRHSATRISPLGPVIEASACARMVPGLASSPPQLPEWWPPSRHIASACAILATACACIAGAGAGPALAASTDAGATLYARPVELLGHVLRFRGSFGPAGAGSTVQVQRLLTDGSWAPAATAVVAPDGSFVARWRADVMGAQTIRALLAGDQAQAEAATADPPPTTHVTIFRPAVASWYGPGFYGKHTACGQVMSHRLLGVAHRTLPCGTPVTLLVGGRSLTAPVIDRGPFTTGIEPRLPPLELPRPSERDHDALPTCRW